MPVIAALPVARRTASTAISRWLHDNTPTPRALRTAGSLATKSRQHLQRSAATLREFTTIRLEVTGHSDEREGATREEREAVALTRARVVATYLVTVEGIDPARLVLRSAGAREPIDASSSARGRARNRRVDFTVLAHATVEFVEPNKYMPQDRKTTRFQDDAEVLGRPRSCA